MLQQQHLLVGQNRRGQEKIKWKSSLARKNAPVNGPILMEKANKIAEAAGHSDFKATEEWFN